MAVNVSKLYAVKSMAMASMAHTFAAKYKRSVSWAYQKYLRIQNGLKGMMTVSEREGKPPLIAKFGFTPIRYKRLATETDDKKPWNLEGITVHGTRTQLVDRLLAQECELCGSTEQVEIHHVRKLKDLVNQYRRQEKPAWVVRMAQIRRKTLVVCNKCHQAIHRGTHDGKPV